MGNHGSREHEAMLERATSLLSERKIHLLRRSWEACDVGQMNATDFSRLVLQHHAPRAASDELFKLFAGNSSYLTFEQLALGLAILCNEDARLRKDKFDASKFLPKEWIEHPPVLYESFHQHNTSSLYTVLAGVTHLIEDDVRELEIEWSRLAPNGNITTDRLLTLLTPPLSPQIVSGVFRAFDENHDEVIDFRELVCGLSAMCRGPYGERLKFIFKMFSNADGVVVSSKMLDTIADCPSTSFAEISYPVESPADELDLAAYLEWANQSSQLDVLANCLRDCGHLALALRPQSLEEERAIVLSYLGLMHELNSSQKWMLVPTVWWNQWREASSQKIIPAINTSELLVNPEDDNAKFWHNLSSISSEGGHVRFDCQRNVHFEIIPPTLWSALVCWYGHIGPTLPRYVIMKDDAGKVSLLPPYNTRVSSQANYTLELHPITLIIYRHEYGASSVNFNSTNLYLKATATFDWMRDSLMDLSHGGKICRRVPKFTASFSCVTKLDDITSFLCKYFHFDPEIVRFWLMSKSGMKECASRLHHDHLLLLDDPSMNLNKIGLESGSGILLEVRNEDFTWPEELLAMKEQAKASLSTNFGRPQTGVCGLNNLGNTCYMNSALQCLVHCQPLTQFFLHMNIKSFIRNANENCIASEYANLIKDMHTGDRRVVAPTHLKIAMGRNCILFTPNVQHDSQEFLSALLDLLHEELNAKNKFMCHKQEYSLYLLENSCVSDDTLSKECSNAFEAWNAYREKNDSIISRHFFGQLRSEVRCCVCDNVSTSFEVFSHLALPLPMDTNVLLFIRVAMIDGSIPRCYALAIPAEQTIKHLLIRLQQLLMTPHKFILLELFANGKLSCELGDLLLIKQIERSPLLYAFQLPHHEGHRPILAIHRKMEPCKHPFLLFSVTYPCVFGSPFVAALRDRMTGEELYQEIWRLACRFLYVTTAYDIHRKPKNPTNRALHDDDCNTYPFQLCIVSRESGGIRCPKCDWHHFCTGCVIPLNKSPIESLSQDWLLGVDWDTSAFYLRLQHQQLLHSINDATMADVVKTHTEPINITSCIETLTAPERMGESNKVMCDNCQTKTCQLYKSDICKAPDILVLHIKRFVHHNGSSAKITKPIAAPLDNFDLTPYIVPNGDVTDRYIYDCFAISNHHGEMGFGHYISYCRHLSNDQPLNQSIWRKFNDSRIDVVSADQVDVAQAYILFYRRR